jgi:hypothetical protein
MLTEKNCDTWLLVSSRVGEKSDLHMRKRGHRFLHANANLCHFPAFKSQETFRWVKARPCQRGTTSILLWL